MKAQEVLQSILTRFKDGDIPEAIAIASFPIPNIPCAKWSLLNRLCMLFSGTQDARGYRQWLEAKRYVKKGSKAIWILAPRIVKDKEKEKMILAGFLTIPVFRVEDTDGEPLDYQQIELPELPLMDRAKEWGISVTAIPGNYSYHGYYSDKKKLIALATPDEKTFFHELSHASEARLNGGLKKGQDPEQEIIAELSAQVLCRIVGKTMDSTLGNSYKYIEEYAQTAGQTPHHACMTVISTVEKVLNLILKGGEQCA